MKLSVIMPVYNEDRTIAELLDKIIAVKLPGEVQKEIVVVNDGSTDRTGGIVERYVAKGSVRLLTQDNMGKTAAVLKGLAESEGDVFIIQDGDLEYDPVHYAKLLQPIIDGKYSVVYGSRFMGSIKNMKPLIRFANFMTNLTLNMIYGTNLTDNNTCYKVFKKSVLDGITITSTHYGFDCELTVKVLKKGIKIHEVPIHYAARTKEEGKKITFVTALDSYLQIFCCALKG